MRASCSPERQSHSNSFWPMTWPCALCSSSTPIGWNSTAEQPTASAVAAASKTVLVIDFITAFHYLAATLRLQEVGRKGTSFRTRGQRGKRNGSRQPGRAALDLPNLLNMLAPQTRIERATCPLGGGCSIH